MINIVACASDNYTMQCGVMMCSVCENNKNEAVNFYIFVDALFSEAHKKDLEDLASGYSRKKVFFVLVSDERIKEFLKFETYLYTRHVFYRLLMAELLPYDVERVLYLDCDVIVRHSISHLFEIGIDNYIVGVVHDSQEAVISQFNRLEYSYDKGYFNSGVILVNLKRWREKDSTHRLLNYIGNNSAKIVLPDQDPLNVVFQDDKVFLPLTYNFQSGFLLKPEAMLIDYSKYKSEIQRDRLDPVILHLSGERPWIKGCMHPYKGEYFKYRSLTKWKDAPLWNNPAPLKERIFKSNALRSIFSKLGLCHVIPNNYMNDISLKEK